MEAICLAEYILEEDILSSGKHSFQWKQFLLVKAIPLGWNQETSHFGENHSF